MNNRQSNK